MTESLITIHNLCIEKNLPFATFRMPQQSASRTYIQVSTEGMHWRSIHDISEKEGFVMAPFDTRNGKQYIMVRPDITIEGNRVSREVIEQINALPSNAPPGWNVEKPIITGKKAYIDQVKTIRKNISTGFFQKAVLSRVETVEGNYISAVSLIFNKICKRHPNAFVYMFKSDDHFWMGASPEPLLRLRDQQISTVSLAGTRDYSKKNMQPANWTMKEVLEQEYVTRYIHDALREFRVRDYRVTSPYVKKAGDLVHLRTDFTFSHDQLEGRIWEFLDRIHPTPAVAGQPKDEAISFIKQLEPHDREYYAGFLGPVESCEVVDLFVNLRCMKITPDYLSLFIGGGITLESVPEDEWEETRLKAQSLMQIIESFAYQKDEKTAT
jgi:isochorismate synthase